MSSTWKGESVITVVMATQDVCKPTFMNLSPVRERGQAVSVSFHRRGDRGPESMSDLPVGTQFVSGSDRAGSIGSEPEAQPYTSNLWVGWEKDQDRKLAKDQYWLPR